MRARRRDAVDDDALGVPVDLAHLVRGGPLGLDVEIATAAGAMHRGRLGGEVDGQDAERIDLGGRHVGERPSSVARGAA